MITKYPPVDHGRIPVIHRYPRHQHVLWNLHATLAKAQPASWILDDSLRPAMHPCTGSVRVLAIERTGSRTRHNGKWPSDRGTAPLSVHAIEDFWHPRKTRNRAIGVRVVPKIFPMFPKQHGRQFALAAICRGRNHFLSSGDRIRTCDLWVMSQPVTGSCRRRCLNRARHRWLGVHAVTPRSTPYGQLHRVSFTNPFTNAGAHPQVISGTESSASFGPVDASCVIAGVGRTNAASFYFADISAADILRQRFDGDLLIADLEMPAPEEQCALPNRDLHRCRA
jgi:hypothetical protein